MQSKLIATARAGFAAFALLAVSAVTMSGTAQAQNRVVEIVNDTGYTMMEFYASNVDRTSWEEDILGADVLPSGYSVDIDIDDGSGQCLFDFRAVFEDGDEIVDEAVNVCEVVTFTYE
ncbi:hypothetical protein [Salinarimonas sp.]|uniref:hypothetical protein n=1 Tax=Salinarimonas sp. TaxID=2766526 RepID=UPI0032D8C379